MSTHSVKAKCKICKKDLVVQVDDGYTGPLDGLLAMATCNRCYDLRDKREKATENIKNACLWLTQHPEASKEKLEQARIKLEKWTRDYAEVMMAYNNSTTLVWSPEFAQNLMQQPDKWYEQLRFYRQTVREQHAMA